MRYDADERSGGAARARRYRAPGPDPFGQLGGRAYDLIGFANELLGCRAPGAVLLAVYLPDARFPPAAHAPPDMDPAVVIDERPAAQAPGAGLRLLVRGGRPARRARRANARRPARARLGYQSLAVAIDEANREIVRLPKQQSSGARRPGRRATCPPAGQLFPASRSSLSGRHAAVVWLLGLKHGT